MADSVAPSGGAGKVDSTHSSTDRARMMPPTRLMKMLARSYRPWARLRRAGNRYGGSSMMSGVGRTVPRQSLSTAATAMALKMPPT